MDIENKIYKKGTFWERLLALIIDEIILLVIALILSFLFSSSLKNLPNMLFWIISVLYGTLFIWKSGHTPGQKLLKLKVVTTSYQPVSLGYALLRETVRRFISGIVFNLG